MDINELILSDAAVEGIETGAWVGDIPDLPGVRLKVLGSSAKAHVKANQAKLEAARKKSRKDLSAEQAADCIREVLAEVTLVDWDGITDGGKSVKFDRELAKKWLTSRNGKKLADAVFWAAQKLDQDANSYVESVTKN